MRVSLEATEARLLRLQLASAAARSVGRQMLLVLLLRERNLELA
jgi:hypothetical protein